MDKKEKQNTQKEKDCAQNQYTPEYYEDKKSFIKTYNELYSDKFPLQR